MKPLFDSRWTKKSNTCKKQQREPRTPLPPKTMLTACPWPAGVRFISSTKRHAPKTTQHCRGGRGGFFIFRGVRFFSPSTVRSSPAVRLASAPDVTRSTPASVPWGVLLLQACSIFSPSAVPSSSSVRLARAPDVTQSTPVSVPSGRGVFIIFRGGKCGAIGSSGGGALSIFRSALSAQNHVFLWKPLETVWQPF